MGGLCSRVVAPAPPGKTPQWSKESLAGALDHIPKAQEHAANGLLDDAKSFPKSLANESMFEWSFDIFAVQYSDLPGLAYAALRSHPELSAPASNIDQDKLWRYVCELSARYHPRPFHSFRHAVDVLLATSSLMRMVLRDKADAFRDPIVVGALLIAALMHDVEHPGCMNSLLVATSHPLAAESATSVLERHHAAVGLALLERPQLDFLCNLPAAERTRFVELVRDAVLATDVTSTVPLSKDFRTLLEAGGTPTSAQVMTMVIKAADISNPTRSLAVYQQWIEGVMDEFFVQGDLERDKGLPLSMNCDRESVVVAKAQVGFISFLVAPLFGALATYAPALQPLVDALERNKGHFASLAA